MGLSGYDYNPLISGYNFSGMMPYLQQVWQTPNVSFRGGAQSTENADNSAALYAAAQQAAQAQAAEETAASAQAGAIPVIPDETTESSGSGLGMITGVGATLALGGGALYLLKKGKFGKAGEAVKSMFGKSNNSSVSTILKKLTAVKGRDNKIKFMIPGKTTTVKGEAAINDLARNYGIESAVSAERQAFKAGKSAIDKFDYVIADGEKFTVYSKDGVITKVTDKNGDDVINYFTEADKESYEKMEKALKELVKEEKEVDANILKGVTDIHYTNTYNDDALRLSISNYEAKNAPKLNEFTTLERFEFNSPEMQSYVLNSDEKVFANSKFFKDGKLIDGVKVSKFTDNIGNGFKGNFEGRTLVSVIKPDGTVLPKGSAGYENIAGQCQKDIDKLLRRVYEKRDYIPTGATIVTG